MTIIFTTGPIDNSILNVNIVEILIRNTDPSSSANVTVSFYNESSSPELLVNLDSFTVSPNSTEREVYSAASLSSFLVEVEIELNNRNDATTATAVHPTVTLFDATSEFVQFVRLLVSTQKPCKTLTIQLRHK
ncbi:hypothetical protein LC087_09700 [Bacillus carboniphilus]|uniref:Uncharacterized protein n=1 Tax=Bacillus carboniphilus TaxID=86663 RepID=A0ABY9JPH7_9BACI|nr:hypothetical protein [Bacillus carboniphilus]WLR41217.1 hypothetical protein LC087_09700 [Bacillus carboniphilus]